MLTLTLLITFLTCLINLILAHAHYFVQMGIMFAVTFMLKKLFVSANSKTTASLIGLAGYSLTIAIFFSLIGAVMADIKGTPIADPNYLKDLVDSFPSILK